MLSPEQWPYHQADMRYRDEIAPERVYQRSATPSGVFKRQHPCPAGTPSAPLPPNSPQIPRVIGPFNQQSVVRDVNCSGDWIIRSKNPTPELRRADAPVPKVDCGHALDDKMA